MEIEQSGFQSTISFPPCLFLFYLPAEASLRNGRSDRHETAVIGPKCLRTGRHLFWRKNKWWGRTFAHHVFFVLISTRKWTKNSGNDSWHWTPMRW